MAPFADRKSLVHRAGKESLAVSPTRRDADFSAVDCMVASKRFAATRISVWSSGKPHALGQMYA
jgi:hypothetical protein